MRFEEIKNNLLNETIYKGVHKSGLTVVVHKKPEFDKFYSVISTKYGSNHVCFKDGDMAEFKEVPDGIAHFLEHKMFEQPDGTNAFDKFSMYGANANAYTSFNNTAYRGSGLSKYVNRYCDIFSFIVIYFILKMQ